MDGQDTEVPSPHLRSAAALLGRDAASRSGSTVARSGSLLQVASSLTRWPTRRASLLPVLDPSLALFNFEDEGPSFALEVDDDEMDRALELESWLTTTRPKGRMLGMRKDHRLSPKELPAWAGYSSNALDWDALMTWSSLKHDTSAPPRRVLDLGCGVGAHWCLEMLQREGWDQSQFVGLDAAPVAVTSTVLPHEYSSRLSFVQHNFLGPLPFDDGRFDLVRLSALFSSVPEDKMSNLLDEVQRVLTPDGQFSIVEAQTGFYLPTPSHPEAAEYYLPVKNAFVKLLEERFINARPLSLLPAGLAMSFGRFETGVADQIQLPGWRLGAGDVISEEETRARVWLHSYAQYIEACTSTLAASAIPLPPDTDHLTHYNSSNTRQIAEFDTLVASYASSLIDIASLPHLLTSSFGWEPTMDLEAARQLSEVVIPGFADQLEDNEELAREVDIEEEWVEVTRQQLGFRKREAEVELKEVLGRIGSVEMGERKELGSIRVGRWKARKE